MTALPAWPVTPNEPPIFGEMAIVTHFTPVLTSVKQQKARESGKELGG
jgi:hypothetical protein